MAYKDLMLNGWFVRFVLVFWLVSTIFILFLLGRVDWIVHHELYNFGLQFSIEWASNYWAFLKAIYALLAVPFVLNAVYFGLEIWRFIRVRRGSVVERKPVEPVKPIDRSGEAAEENHVHISCPKCKRVFSRPMVMLDFSSGKARLVEVCPYCNHILGSVENIEVEKEKDNVKFVNSDIREIEQK